MEDTANNKSRRRSGRWSRSIKRLRLALRFTRAIRPRRGPVTAVEDGGDPAGVPDARRDSFLDKYGVRDLALSSGEPLTTNDESRAALSPPLGRLFVDPHGDFFFGWTIVLCLAVLYNYWTLMPRIAFIENEGEAMFFAGDYTSDVVYAIDVVVRWNLGFFQDGILRCKHRWRYVRSWGFAFDVLASAPLDLIYLSPLVGVNPLLRLPRLVKLFRLWNFSKMLESRLHYSESFVFRVVKLVHLIALCIHWDASFYFLLSKEEGFGINSWVYPATNGTFALTEIKYLYSFHWATLALTTIGDIPPPHTQAEFGFTIANYMLGVFIFATLVGQFGQIISNANENQAHFERLLDSTKRYMRRVGAPESVQRKVTRWYEYARQRGRIEDRNAYLAIRYLPDKLRAKVAVHANLTTLRKVDLFGDIPPGLLHELVLKMQSLLLTPGDIVCRYGDVGREMYIVSNGKLAVTTETGDLICQLSSGDYFGEISLLGINRSNKRTADVYSIGYSELLVLTKTDLEEPFKNHPEFMDALRRKAVQRLQFANGVSQKVRESPSSKSSKVRRSRSSSNGAQVPLTIHRRKESSLRSPATLRLSMPDISDVNRLHVPTTTTPIINDPLEPK